MRRYRRNRDIRFGDAYNNYSEFLLTSRDLSQHWNDCLTGDENLGVGLSKAFGGLRLVKSAAPVVLRYLQLAAREGKINPKMLQEREAKIKELIKLCETGSQMFENFLQKWNVAYHYLEK